MTIAFSCPGCGKQFKVSDNMAGRKAKCSACATVMLVPSAEAFAPAPTRPVPPPPPQEEYVTDEAAPRRRKKKKKTPTGMILALVGVLLATGFCCVGVGTFFGLGYFHVWDPFNLFGGLASSDLKYMPDNCQMVVVVNWDQIESSEAWKSIKNELPPGMREEDLNKKTPIQSANLKRIVVGIGGNLTGMGTPDVVGIIKTNADIGKGDLQKGLQGGQPKLLKVKDFEIYHTDQMAICKLDDTTVLFGNKADTLKRVIERDKAPDLSDDLKAAMNQANFKKSIAFAVGIKTIAKSTGAGARLAPPPGGRGAAPAPNPAGDAISKAEGAAGYVHLGSTIDINVTLLCADSKGAEAIVKEAKDGITKIKGAGLPADFMSLLDALDIDNSGSKVIFKAEYKPEVLIKAFKAGSNLMRMFGLLKPPGAGVTVAEVTPPANRQPPERPRAQSDVERSVTVLSGRTRKGSRAAMTAIGVG